MTEEDDKPSPISGPQGDPVLPREVQEHLGRRLRNSLRAEEPKPTFLGETNVPPQFERFVRKLEAGERGERQGYEAVKAALLDTPPTPDET